MSCIIIKYVSDTTSGVSRGPTRTVCVQGPESGATALEQSPSQIHIIEPVKCFMDR